MVAIQTSAFELAAKRIGKSFPGVRALDGVDLSVAAGEFHAVLGENGAGKSTLMNILSGVFPPDTGSIEINGEPVSLGDTRAAQASGIAMIHQELNLIPGLSIAENLFLGREFRTRLGFVDYRRLNEESKKLLAQLDLHHLDPSTPVERLRVGQQQMIEIAKALSFASKVIIMDEPTSAISEAEVDALFKQIEALKGRGVAIIYITHKLDEVWRAADTITILRDGKLVDSRTLKDFGRGEAVRLMVGREMLAGDARERSEIGDGAKFFSAEMISLPHPSRPEKWLLKDVSFSLRRGEILGVFGLMGAGRTELLECLFGLHAKTMSGTVSLDNQVLQLESPNEAIAAGIGLAPEDRKADGVVLGMSVRENTSLAVLERMSRWGFVRRRAEAEEASRYVDRLRIKTPSLTQSVRNLSGGNQQKVVLAKWLATDPAVLMLDEPTRGIDINAKREIYDLLAELAAQGLGVLVVSSELPEILAIADRIVVLREGRKSAEFNRDDADEERLLRAALPGHLDSEDE